MSTPPDSTTAHSAEWPAAWPPSLQALVDDAAVFPPGDAPLSDALAAYVAREGRPESRLVRSFVARDVQLSDVIVPVPVSVVVTGGAGAIPGALRQLQRSPATAAGLEIALRDLDDLAGNARRVLAAVDAARDEGLLQEDTPVYVELPAEDPRPSWLAAADEVAGAELALKLRTGGTEADQIPSSATLAAWVDAALDREVTFKCTAGLHRAVRHTDEHDGLTRHGFLNLLLATRSTFDGDSRDEVVALLDERDPAALLERWHGHGDDAMLRTRRWFTSFGSCSVDEPLADLRTLGLLAPGLLTEEDA
ncbi:hypothetical protein [Nocardioides pacificus]